MNAPINTLTAAMSSHGEPCINRMMPQLMKKVNNKNVRMASANFIAPYCNGFHFWRKCRAEASVL